MNNERVWCVLSCILSCLIMAPVQAAAQSGQSAPLVNPPPASASSDTHIAPAPAASVLERFRTHTGPRTPAALKALFDAPVAADTLQLPSIALSDGAATVVISVAVDTPDNRAPNVAFNGAQLISLTRSQADGWSIEALPAAGTLKASLILLTGSGTREIPLTVSPTLPKETDLSEPGFVAFLRSAATTQPEFDLNGDGRRDYVDEYIFTANYLTKAPPAAQETGGVQVPVPQPPAPARLPAPPVAGSPQAADAPGAASAKTPYQRNLSIRNQRLREMRERRHGTGPLPETPAVAAPPAP